MEKPSEHVEKLLLSQSEVREIIKKMHAWEKDVFKFAFDLWGLIPQPVKPEYEAQWNIVLKSTHDEWENWKKEVGPEWFGDYNEQTSSWVWYDYKRGTHITWQQVMTLLAVKKALRGDAKKFISIVSGHGTGKSSSISWILLYFLLCYYNSQIAATAPTANQMHDVLWKECALWIDRIRDEEIKQLYEWQNSHIRIKINPDTWFARAKTASKENSEALAGIHAENVLLLADEACHDDQTEILTEEGWKFFKDLNKKERVYTLNHHTGKTGLELPIQYHKYPHDGLMYYQRVRGSDFKVTGNHDMYVKTRSKGYRKKKAHTFTKNSDYFYPRVMDWDGSNSMSEDMVKLYAWLITEGYIIRSGPKKAIVGFAISQCERYNYKNVQEIKDLLTRLGLKYSIYNNKDIHVHNSEFARGLLDFGTGSYNKKIPQEIKMLNKDLLKAFIDVSIKGDGYSRSGRDIFYTSSKQLADDMQEIIIKTGYNSNIKKRKIKGNKKWIVNHMATTKVDGYVVSRSHKSTGGKINGLKQEYYKGNVYCVTVPNGLIYTRRNGYVLCSGNSAVSEQIYNTAEGALTSSNVLFIMISNGTRTLGYFYDSHHKNKDQWQTFLYDGEQSPIVDKTYVERQERRHGRGSDEFIIRVSGGFPKVDAMDDSGYYQLTPESKITVKQVLSDEDVYWFGRVILGVDPSGLGKDKASFILRDRFKAMCIKELQTTNPRQIAEMILFLIDKYKIKAEDVVIDAFGIGSDVSKEVAVASFGKYNCYSVLVGNKPAEEERYNAHLFKRLPDEVDDVRKKVDKQKDMYLNIRALCHARLSKWCIQGGEILDTNAVNSPFKQEISSIRAKRTLQGNTIQLMPKKEMQKLRIPSPNKADALALTFLRNLDEDILLNTVDNSDTDYIDDPYSLL